MYQPYIRISTGNLFTAIDNNPLNTVGCIYSPPANQALPQSTKGQGAQPVVKYVQYKSTSQPAPEPAHLRAGPDQQGDRRSQRVRS